MTTVTIKINDKAQIRFDGECYMPDVWNDGGVECRNPANGETIFSKAKWDFIEVYASSLQHAIKAIAKYRMLEKEEYSSLKEYLDVFEKHVDDMTKALKNV
jgi:hypothetical protein